MAAEVANLAIEHFLLVLVSVGLASAIGIPLGILLSRRARARPPVMAGVGVIQTIPSLALFGFLIPFIGIGTRTAGVALVLYALLPIVRSTLTGMTTIDPAVLESAEALGMTPREKLRLVELPLAAPSILAGLRIAAVTTVGTATIAAVIGAGGLGELIFRGVATVDSRQILAGAAPAALMALILEGGFSWLERRLFRRS